MNDKINEISVQELAQRLKEEEEQLKKKHQVV